MKIRKAQISDLSGIMRMYESCVKGMLENGIDQWDETYPNIEVIGSDIKSGTYFVAEENKIIVAGINIDKNQDPLYLDINWEDHENSFLVVHRLGVSKEVWGKGVGKALMMFTERLAQRMKLKSIRLDTYSNNPDAMNFYKKLGYNKLGYIYLKPNKNEYYCFEKIIK